MIVLRKSLAISVIVALVGIGCFALFQSFDSQAMHETSPSTWGKVEFGAWALLVLTPLKLVQHARKPRRPGRAHLFSRGDSFY